MAEQADNQRPWLQRALMALLLPPLLAAPIVILLQRQANAIHAAERELESALALAWADVGALQGLPRARALVFARRAVLDAIEDARPDVVALLNVLGGLPSGVRVDSVLTLGEDLSLAGTSDAATSAIVDALEAGGLRNVRFEPAKPGEFALVAQFGTVSVPTGELPP